MPKKRKKVAPQRHYDTMDELRRAIIGDGAYLERGVALTAQLAVMLEMLEELRDIKGLLVRSTGEALEKPAPKNDAQRISDVWLQTR